MMRPSLTHRGQFSTVVTPSLPSRVADLDSGERSLAPIAGMVTAQTGWEAPLICAPASERKSACALKRAERVGFPVRWSYAAVMCVLPPSRS